MGKVIKRDGSLQKFDPERIFNAIDKGFIGFDFELTVEELDIEKAKIKQEVNQQIMSLLETTDVDVEEIQDTIVTTMRRAGYRKVANAYQKYRKNRDLDRALIGVYESLSNEDTEEKTENANVCAWNPAGRLLHVAEDIVKIHSRNKIYSKDIVQAIDDGKIYVHDMNWTGTGSTTCMQIDLEHLFKGGFHTGHGYLREPGSIQSAFQLAAIAIQANQNDQHGGQSLPYFDRALAPYVLKTFKKELKNIYSLWCRLNSYDYYEKTFETIDNLTSIQVKPSKILTAKVLQEALDATRNKTYQGAEAFIHNLNTLSSRAGSQVPFSSVNFGLDITPEGRMVSEMLLKAQMSGLGKHETPIFPILIYTLKKGINFESSDPNYDIFRLAMECSSKRLFPTYCFVDSSFNLPFYEKDPYYGACQTMGCRTRVMANVNGREGAVSRGNLSFTTVNLPMLALNAKGNIDKFYKELDEAMALCDKALLERFEIQANMYKWNFPSLMGEGIWLDSDKLDNQTTLREVLKHGTLSIGFIGLAECLKVLCGKHHGESKEADKLGYQIVKYMKAYCDKRTKETHMNFTCLGTPAETYCFRALKSIRAKYGIVPEVSDRDYITNSSHVPVYYPISIADKIKIEGKYHKLENAGHIMYVEVDGDISNNLDAFEEILHMMSEADVGYGAVNIPIVECPICYHSFRGSTDIHVCPNCGYNELEGIATTECDC